MHDQEKGLFTEDERRDITKVVGAADHLLANPQFRRDLGDIACATYTNPVSRAAASMLSDVPPHVTDEEFAAFNETTEYMSSAIWGNRPRVNLDRGKLIEDLLSAALNLQTAANRCIRADALASASDEWDDLLFSLKTPPAHDDIEYVEEVVDVSDDFERDSYESEDAIMKGDSDVQ